MDTFIKETISKVERLSNYKIDYTYIEDSNFSFLLNKYSLNNTRTKTILYNSYNLLFLGLKLHLSLLNSSLSKDTNNKILVGDYLINYCFEYLNENNETNLLRHLVLKSKSIVINVLEYNNFEEELILAYTSYIENELI